MAQTQELQADAVAEPVTEPVEGAAKASPNGPIRIEPDLQFKKELAEFGGTTFDKCYQCATCSAVCDLSTEDAPFPRREMAWVQWGLKDKLVRDANLWRCHFCGQCSERCPRGADPGESMMALRRYAISRYDWTGLSRKLYTSRLWEFGALLFVALLVVGLFAWSGAFTEARMVTTHVSVNTFIPVDLVHNGDWAMAGTLMFFLFTNSFRMARLMLDGQKVPLGAYLSEAKTFLLQFTLQRDWQRCAGEKLHWLKHFFLVTGYVTMFLLVMVFLDYQQVDAAGFVWVDLLGYYGTAAIVYFSVDAIIGRLRKTRAIHKSSHDSDWMFLILLFLTGVTGFGMHVFRMMDLPMATYIIYVIHLAIAIPMLVVEVPFMKWSHLMYRPLALYLSAVKAKARQMETT